MMSRRLLIVSVLLSFLLLAAGCRTEVTRPVAVSEPRSTAAVSPTPVMTSGPLRLAWASREHLNPLNTRDFMGRAVMDLIYDGLFEWDGRQIQSVLAESSNWQSDHMTLDIPLRQDISFHHGAPVLAADVVASLNQGIRFTLDDPQADPQRVAVYQQISGIDAVSDKLVRIRLAAPQPGLLRCLDLPIVPQDRVKDLSYVPIPGTGLFRIREGTGGQTPVLERVDQGQGVRVVQLSRIDDLRARMVAFENDLLDLVVLEPPVYATYAARATRRVQSWPINRYTFLLPGNQQPDLTALRRLLPASNNSWQAMVQPDLPCLMPPLFDRPAVRDPLQVQTELSEVAAAEGAGAPQLQPLEIIVEEQSHLSAYAERLAVQIRHFEVPVEVVRQDAETFAASLASGQFSLALVEKTLPERLDLAYFRTHPHNAAAVVSTHADYLSLLAEAERLLATWTNETETVRVKEDTSAALQRTLQKLLVRTPWLCLSQHQGGVLLGDRVRGSLYPDVQHPLAGLEGLFVWSGSS